MIHTPSNELLSLVVYSQSTMFLCLCFIQKKKKLSVLTYLFFLLFFLNNRVLYGTKCACVCVWVHVLACVSQVELSTENRWKQQGLWLIHLSWSGEFYLPLSHSLSLPLAMRDPVFLSLPSFPKSPLKTGLQRAGKGTMSVRACAIKYPAKYNCVC